MGMGLKVAMNTFSEALTRLELINLPVVELSLAQKSSHQSRSHDGFSVVEVEM
jgi:hypothetical protein